MTSRASDAAWPFVDAPNVAVFTSWRILRGQDWIHYVTHDEEDGAWQFHPNSGPTPPSDAALVALHEMVAHDPSLAELADLPIGWCAWRDSEKSPWQRAENPDAKQH